MKPSQLIQFRHLFLILLFIQPLCNGCGPSNGEPGTTAEQDELAEYVEQHADDEGVEPPPS